jgi:hypothetical protein
MQPEAVWAANDDARNADGGEVPDHRRGESARVGHDREEGSFTTAGVMAEHGSPNQTVDESPEVLNLRRERRAQQRAHDDHIRDMMRAMVEAIDDSKKRSGSEPSSDRW